MSHEESDAALLRAYRNLADEGPLPGIDDRLLRIAERKALKRRGRRYLAPLAAAAALLLIMASAQRMWGISAPRTQSAVAADATDRMTAQLLRLQPSPTAHSMVADFLLDPNSLSPADAETNAVP